MKVLRGTLTFVLGMLIGIILFVVAIGGTVVIIGTQVTVGDLQKSLIKNEVIAPDSNLYNSTMLDAVKGVLGDIKNFDTLSLKTLYTHYGIKLLNGISGIDFTDKEFYDTPITELTKDLSIIVNSFTLEDIGKIAGVDFSTYNMPILTDNMDNNVSTAVDNVLNIIKGDLSIRAIKDNFGIDIGTTDNDLIAALQDVKVSQFGNVINVLRANQILNADTDAFLPVNGEIKLFVEADEYEEVTNQQLTDAAYVPSAGIETCLVGGKDTDGDGKADLQDIREMRYIKKTVEVDGQTQESFVADLSCYKDGFDPNATDKTFYRHVKYKEIANSAAANGKKVYVIGYANRIEKLGATADACVLLQKGFIPLTDIDLDSADFWGITDETITKDSSLKQLENTTGFGRPVYKRIYTGTSSALLQKIAYLTIAELQDADGLLDSLTIGDVVEINDETSKIIISLKDSTFKSIGSDINDLTLADILDIKYDEYVEDPHGQYVRVQSESGRYYTLYNAAEHTGMQRYVRNASEGSSSVLLQRFASSTVSGFSTAFDSLLLADVLQMDIDIYAVADSEYIANNSNERFFYYDEASCVYRIADDEYRKQHTDITYYHIIKTGESSSLLKKLAYVKVDGMSTAIEAVIDDLMLSEVIDVYEDNAIKLDPAESSYDENAKYFIEYDENANFCGEDERGKFVYVCDSSGGYVASNFTFVPVDATSTAPIFYTYNDYRSLSEADALEQMAFGNLYYKDKTTGEYKRNIVLCSYMYYYTDGTGAHPYRKEVLYRVLSQATQADSENGIYEGIQYIFEGDLPQYGLYIKDNYRGFISYDGTSANPAFADKPLYALKKSEDNSLKYFILHGDFNFIQALKGNELIHGPLYGEDVLTNGVRYDKRSCENIYIKSDDGQYVFIDGRYDDFNPELHDASVERFEKKLGYIAHANEAYFDTDESSHASVLSPIKIEFIREKSVPVLRLLAGGTLSEMSGIISNATIGDIIEAEHGSLFDSQQLKETKISEVGTVFKTILSDMTVGELMTWSKMTKVDDRVKIALENITIERLFNSIEITPRHTFEINMFKLYGYYVNQTV